MSLVNHRYKFIVLIALISMNVFADFKRNQVRYLSFKDLQLNLIKDFGLEKNKCIGTERQLGFAFAYPNPSTGKPISSKPNFNFLNSYTKCLSTMVITLDNEDLLLGEELKNTYDLDANVESFKDEDFLKIIEFQTLRLVGTESVLKSYGHVQNLEEFKQIILTTIKKKYNPYFNLKTLTRDIIYFISLRDEYLSY